MDRLAPELLTMILSHVPFLERAHLRLVNKFWRDVIDSLKLNRLVLIDRDWSVFNELWFHTNARNTLDDPGLANVFDLAKLPEKLVNSTLRNLRLLFIDLSTTPLRHAENFLNQFKQLEELNLFGRQQLLTPQKLTLDLPRLRILSFRCDFEKATIELQTPCLTAFQCLSLSSCQFAFPDRLTHLAVHWVKLSSIEQFVNLQYLYCFQLHSNEPVLDRLLKLQEIHTVDSVNMNTRLDTLYKLDEERIRLKRADLRLYCRGIELGDYTANEINLDLDEFEAAYYMLIKTPDLPFYSPAFKFGRLANLWLRGRGEDPADFFDKFRNIRNIEVLYLVTEQSFVKFIGNFRNLNSISFHHSNSEDLKRQLAECQPTISRLEFADTPSLDSVLKFKYLMTLKFSKKLDFNSSNETIAFIEQFSGLFERLRYLQRVLIMDKDIYWILSVSENRFSIELRDYYYHSYSEGTKFGSLEQVRSYLERKNSSKTSNNMKLGAFKDKCCLN